MPQDLSADGIFPHVERVYADCFRPRVDVDDAWGEALLEFRSEVRGDWLFDFDVRKEAVGSRRWTTMLEAKAIEEMEGRTDWAELCVVLAYTLDCVQLHVDGLPRPQFCEHDIWVDRRWRTSCKDLLLLSCGTPNDVLA